VLLVVGGFSFYLLLPSLLAVFGQWRSLLHLQWPFALLTLVCETAAYVCIWELDRIALRTKAWFPVIAAQLSGNAAGRVVPGGGVTATAFATSMLGRAGVEEGEAAAAFATASFLQIGTTLALPVLALPAIIGGAPVNHSLATAATLGAVLFALLLAAGALVFTTDEPIELFGRVVQWSCVGSEHDLVRLLVAPMSELASLADDKETALRQHTNRRGVVARSASVKRTGCLELQELL
jgi:hypothetical protein